MIVAHLIRRLLLLDPTARVHVSGEGGLEDLLVDGVAGDAGAVWLVGEAPLGGQIGPGAHDLSSERGLSKPP